MAIRHPLHKHQLESVAKLWTWPRRYISNYRRVPRTGPPGPDVGAIDPFLRPNYTMVSHVQEHLRLKQRRSGPRSGPRMEMESTRVEIPTSNLVFHIDPSALQLVADEEMGIDPCPGCDNEAIASCTSTALRGTSGRCPSDSQPHENSYSSQPFRSRLMEATLAPRLDVDR
jgi:hypothetical protein